MLNFHGLVIGLKALKKRIPSNVGGQFATLGANVQTFININVLTFISSNLGAKQQAPKCSKLVPIFFWP